MRIQVLSVIIFLLSGNFGLGQDLELRIEKMEIGSIYLEESDDGIVEVQMHEDGPFVKLQCSLINNSDSTRTIQPSSASYYIKFRFDGVNYRSEVFPLAFMDNESIELKNGQKIEFVISDSFLLRTPIYSVNKRNYANDLIKILPTLKLVYRERGLELDTSEALLVGIIE